MTIARYDIMMDILTRAEAKRRMINKLCGDIAVMNDDIHNKQLEIERLSHEITDLTVELKAVVKHDLGE
jgi:hypothetical protein